MGNPVDCKAIAARIIEDARERAAAFETENGRKPKLAVVRVGDDGASALYVANKQRACRKANIEAVDIHRPADVTAEGLMAQIDLLNAYGGFDGIMVQLPLPEKIRDRTQEIIDRIDPSKDVDGLTTTNQGRLRTGVKGFVPCTPAAVMEIINSSRHTLKGRDVVIINRKNLVGMPLADMLTKAGATVTVCHSETIRYTLETLCARADIVITATGARGTVRKDMIGFKTLLIDVGITRDIDGGVHGDCDSAAYERALTYTPVPGGVGVVTVAMLVRNTVIAAEGLK